MRLVVVKTKLVLEILRQRPLWSGRNRWEDNIVLFRKQSLKVCAGFT
jgi:hypothetical protein